MCSITANENYDSLESFRPRVPRYLKRDIKPTMATTQNIIPTQICDGKFNRNGIRGAFVYRLAEKNNKHKNNVRFWAVAVCSEGATYI